MRHYWATSNHMIKVLSCWLLVSSFLLFSSPLLAQNQADFNPWRFERPRKASILSQRSINTIIQDREGYIWAGTWAGLIRYDGFESVNYEIDPGRENWLKSNRITALLEGKDGDIWIGTRLEGAFKYSKQGNQFTQYKPIYKQDSITEQTNVTALLEDRQGNVWLGTEVGIQLINAKGELGEFITEEDGLCHAFINSLYEDSKGNVWAPTHRGLNKIKLNENGGFDIATYFDEDNRLEFKPDNAFHSILEYEREDAVGYFISSSRGLKFWDGNSVESYTWPDKRLAHSAFEDIVLIDDPKPLLALGSDIGLSIFDIEQREFVAFMGGADQASNLSSPYIRSLLLDNTGILWVGTEVGINQYDPFNKRIQLLKNEDYDPARSMVTTITGNAKELWLGTRGSGVFRLDRATNSFKQFSFKLSSNMDYKNKINAMQLDGRGRLYLGTDGAGVVAFDPTDPANASGVIRKYRELNAANELVPSNNYIMGMEASKDGGVWLGSWRGGFHHITIEGQVTSYTDETLSGIPVIAFHEDKKGYLWVGTRGGGLFRLKLDNGQITEKAHFMSNAQDNGLSDNIVNTLVELPNGDMLIGTEGGLNIYHPDTDQFSFFNKVNTTVLTQITSIELDGQGNLWVSNIHGITGLSYQKDSLQELYSLTALDNLQSGFSYSQASFTDEQNVMVFGGTEGVNLLKPSTFRKNPKQPGLVINDIAVFDHSITDSPVLNGRNVFAEEGNLVRLRYDENMVSFRFAALHYAAPEKNQLAFKLSGVDPDWQYVKGGTAERNYANLEPGTYEFSVKGSNNDGVWTDENLVFRFVILPPWWLTYWAKAGYVLVFILLVLLLRRLVIIRINLKNEIQIERLRAENIEEVNRAKLDFFTHISHEFRTPLTLIAGPLEKLQEGYALNSRAKHQVSIIRRNTDRLLRLVNQLLDFRKADAGNVTLAVSEENVVDFLQEIKLSFDEMARDRKIDFSLVANSNVITLWFDKNLFEKIFVNLISNAFKYCKDGGTIKLSLYDADGKVHIAVEDNGSGIAQADMDKVFDLFHGDKHAHTSTGIGLALVRQYITLHAGTVAVESEEDVFTRFTLQLPKGKEHFEDQHLADESDWLKSVQPTVALNETRPECEGEGPKQAKDIESMFKILVAEDNAELRSFIKSLFIGQYIVLEAADGEEALQLAKKEVPDVVISDVMMPKKDGMTLCRELKSALSTSHIPIILLTARTSEVFRINGYELGADHYITKPFNSEALLLNVKNLITARERLQRLFQSQNPNEIDTKELATNHLDAEFLGKVVEAVNQHLSEPDFSIEVLSKEIGVSRIQLYRKLKAITGFSANQLIRQLRLKRGARLLLEGELTIAEITYEVGFSDLQYFRNSFKKQFGVSPSEYLKSL